MPEIIQIKIVFIFIFFKLVSFNFVCVTPVRHIFHNINYLYDLSLLLWYRTDFDQWEHNETIIYFYIIENITELIDYTDIIKFIFQTV